MFILKLLIAVLLYSECYLCYKIVKNPFDQEEDTVDTDEVMVEEMSARIANNLETNSGFWLTNAEQTVQRHLARKQNINVAKNVILFIGDGMSLTTITAAHIYMGQLQNRTGEEMTLSFENFPHIGLSKTYCIDKQVADSACSGTALLTGVKTNYNVIGVNGNVKLNDCAAAQDVQNQVSSIMDWAQKSGKATGVVTNAGITSATPAAAYAHSASRSYQTDADVLKYKHDPKTCPDIAQQLIYNAPGDKLNVIFGGGRTNFLSKADKGDRTDGRNLINEWLQMKNSSGVYISDRKGLSQLKLDGVNHVLGLFSSRDLPYNLESNSEIYPSLAEMVVSAIKILKNVNPSEGYVLLVEGGRIDHGHHKCRALFALDETVQLSEAVNETVNMIDQEDTLVVVTSDHAHTMTFAGYNPRGADILGVTNSKSSTYTVLSYANGPGYIEPQSIATLKNSDISDFKFRYPATVKLSKETHGGEDVGVFALGPWSHLFTGVYEQSTIPHLIGYAACIGNGMTACE